jgi:hypothetical protein
MLDAMLDARDKAELIVIPLYLLYYAGMRYHCLGARAHRSFQPPELQA